MRSLPPPISSFSPYSASDQRTGRFSFSNVSLKAGRCRALCVGQHAVTVEEQRRHQAATDSRALPAEPKISMCSMAMDFTASPTCLRRAGGILLRGIGLEVFPVGVDEGDLQRRRDVHLRAPAGDEVLELLRRKARAAVQHHGDGSLLDHLRYALGRQVGLPRVEAVRGADGRRERVRRPCPR
jgi:hypothetical protein